MMSTLSDCSILTSGERHSQPASRASFISFCFISFYTEKEGSAPFLDPHKEELNVKKTKTEGIVWYPGLLGNVRETPRRATMVTRLPYKFHSFPLRSKSEKINLG